MTMVRIPAPAPISPTNIAVLHARYEAAWEQDRQLELAENDLVDGRHEDDLQKLHYEEARRKIARETDALRLTILYQVPISWPEVLILYFHVWGIADLLSSVDDRNEGEDQAMLVALDTLFDFMAAEIPDVDHEAVGSMFKAGTMLAWKKQRQRAADLEG